MENINLINIIPTGMGNVRNTRELGKIKYQHFLSSGHLFVEKVMTVTTTHSHHESLSPLHNLTTTHRYN